MEIINKFFIPGFLILLTLVSGFWLSNAGKPLNTVIFTIHKLIALAAVIFTVLHRYRLLKNTEIQPLVITLIILSALCIVVLFLTGALMSAGKWNYDVLLTLHRIALILEVFGIVATFYLVDERKQ